jgi:ABC-2 type transport system ATP-binding protein
MAVIEVNGLTKRFGSVVAVDHLSFQVDEGKIVGFLGPNGAGKTTTLRMLLGLVEPSGGTSKVCGAPYWELDNPLHKVGALLDSSHAHPRRTARTHLRLVAMSARVSPAKIDDMLALVGLSQAADRRAGEFSLGMRQRLGLAAALLPEPEVLILDEPANGLDPQGVHWLRELLRKRAAEGQTVLVSSHILAEVAQTVDTVVILDRGRLVTESSLADLTASTKTIVRVRTPKAADLAAAVAGDGAEAKVEPPDRVEITGSTPERVANLAADRAIPIFESTTETPNLEDVFLQLTAGSGPQGVPS